MSESAAFLDNLKKFGHSVADLGFSEGASIEEIDLLEKKIDRKLPIEFKTFLQNANGQNSDKLRFLPDLSILMSTSEIADEYTAQKDYFQDTLEFQNKYQFQNKIRCTVWSESRIPIAGRDGYFLFLDFDPGPDGDYGQVIYLINECDFVVLGKDFSSFLHSYNELIRNGTLKLREMADGSESYFRLTTDKQDFLSGNDLAQLFGQ